MLARLCRTFFVVQIQSLLLLSLAACGDSGGPIRIGLAGPFSDPVGAPMKRAAELAVEEINAAGGVRGRPLELVARDDFGDPDSAVAVASALVGERVVAVIGHVYSGTTLAAAPVYNDANDPVVQISPSSSSPDVTTAAPTPSGSAPATWPTVRHSLATPGNSSGSTAARSCT